MLKFGQVLATECENLSAWLFISGGEESQKSQLRNF